MECTRGDARIGRLKARTQVPKRLLDTSKIVKQKWEQANGRKKKYSIWIIKKEEKVGRRRVGYPQLTLITHERTNDFH